MFYMHQITNIYVAKVLISSCLKDYKTMLHALQTTLLQVKPGWDLLWNNNSLKYKKELKNTYIIRNRHQILILILSRFKQVTPLWI